MILRARSGSLRLVLQTDHAQIAGLFAGLWGGGGFAVPEPLPAVRLAAEQHDYGWLEVEATPGVRPETGRPYDFLHLPTPIHIPVYERAIHHAAAIDPYAGLLVSLHGTGLYRKRYGYMSHLVFKEHHPRYRTIIDRFLESQDQFQARLRDQVQVDDATLWTHYRWLQGWDLLSLFLALTDPAEEPELLLGVVPLCPGGPETAVTARGAGPGLYTVDPWPFQSDSVAVTLPVRHVTDRLYEHDRDFQQAFAAAAVQELCLTLRPHGR